MLSIGVRKKTVLIQLLPHINYAVYYHDAIFRGHNERTKKIKIKFHKSCNAILVFRAIKCHS